MKGIFQTISVIWLWLIESFLWNLSLRKTRLSGYTFTEQNYNKWMIFKNLIEDTGGSIKAENNYSVELGIS